MRIMKDGPKVRDLCLRFQLLFHYIYKSLLEKVLWTPQKTSSDLGELMGVQTIFDFNLSFSDFYVQTCISRKFLMNLGIGSGQYLFEDHLIKF